MIMIENILNAGGELILFLQGLGEWLYPPLRLVTFLGDEEFFLLIMPALFWCVDGLLGLRLGLLLLLSESANYSLRMIFHTPRPYWADPRVRALDHETTFGLPSSHAQNAAAIWGYLAIQSRRRWWRIGLWALVGLIGLSRLYLGVHYPAHVVLGWLFGLAILWIFVRLEEPLRSWLSGQPLAARYAAALGLVLALVLVGVLLRAALSGWPVPPAWAEMAAAAIPEGEPINPMSLDGLMTSTGALLGLSWGAIWLFSGPGYQAGGSWRKRLARFPVGLAGVIILWFGLGSVFPRGDFLLAYLLRFLRYFLVGLWVAAFAPRLFVRLRLADAR
jgi:membrane-associated phospholipid phosphatase